MENSTDPRRKKLFWAYRYRKKIRKSRSEIERLYTKIGKRYTALHPSDYEEALGDLIQEIHSAEQRAEIYREQIRKLEGICTCPNCGAEVSAGNSHCTSCGHLLNPVLQPENRQKVCIYCGEILEEDMRFCLYCGKPVSEPEPSRGPELKVRISRPERTSDSETAIMPREMRAALENPGQDGNPAEEVMNKDMNLTMVMPKEMIPGRNDNKEK